MMRYTYKQIGPCLEYDENYLHREDKAKDLLTKITPQYRMLLSDKGFFITDTAVIIYGAQTIKDVTKICERITELYGEDDRDEDDIQLYDLTTEDSFDYHGIYVMEILEAIKQLTKKEKTI